MKFLSNVLLKAGLIVEGTTDLQGTATAVTQALSDSSTKIATTAFVKGQGYSVGNIYSTDGSLSGNRTITLNGNYLDIAGTTKTRFFANGNVVIDGASPVDAGFKFDVNGTVRVSSFLTVGSDVSAVIKSQSSDGSIYIGGSSLTTSIAALRNIIVSTVGSYSTLTGINNTFYGRAAGLNVTSGASNVFIGSNSGAGITTGARNVFVTSSDAGNLPSSLSNSIHLVAGNGYRSNDASSIPSATHTFIGGGFNTGFAIKDFYFGQMPFTADAGGGLINIVFYAPSGLGTDIGGANFTLAAGRGTGAGTPGDFIIRTSSTTTTGSTLQTLADRIRVAGGTGIVTIANLAGTGSRMVIADSSGVLSTQAIISGNFVTLDTTQTITGLKTFTSKATINTGGTDDQLQLVGTAPSIRLTNAVTGATINGFIAMAGATNNYIQGAVAGDMTIGNQNNGRILFGFGSGTADLKMSLDASGNAVITGGLTIGTTLSSGVYTYTLPSATGTLALASSLASYVPTSRTLTINGTTFDLSANRSWSIATGVSSVASGTGISVSTVNGVATVTNLGLLSASSGTGISVSTNNQSITVTNLGLLSAISGTGISASTVNQQLTITNLGLLSAVSGTGISVTTTNQQITVTNTGILSIISGTGISATTVNGATTITNLITNTNQLTNGAGYITGINSSMVISALGYTPYNSSNPNGYITSSALSSYLPLSGGTMTGPIIMSGTQQIRQAGFSGIEYYNGTAQWQGYIGTENNTGNLRYNSFNGAHTWYANSAQTMALNSSGALFISELNVTGTEGRKISLILPSSYNGTGYSNLIERINFPWYSEYWDIGVKRGGGADIQSMEFWLNGTTKMLELTKTSGLAYLGGNTIWTSANLTNLNQLSNGPGYITSSALSSYLPLSGGTMTGAITTPTGTSIYIGNQNVSTSARLIINWHTDSDYQYLIGKRAGGWTQPMDISFYTGLRYHAHQAYNAHIFYVGGYDSTEAFSIGRGDANVRVNNALFVGGTLNLPNNGLLSINNEPDAWGARFRTNTSTTNLGGQLKNIFWNGGGVNEGIAFTGVGTGGAAMEITNGGNVFVRDSLYANGANSRIQSGTGSVDGMLYDSSGRPALVARGAYPHIELWADVANGNHGGTLRFGGYDNGSSGAYKNWNIGTPGSNLYFLDIGYGGSSNSNPHSGIAGLGAAYGYPGAFTMMRFHNNGNIGIGNFGEYGSEGNAPAFKLDVRGTGRFTGAVSANTTLTVGSGGDSLAIAGAEGRITFRDQALVWTGYVGFRGNLGVVEFPGRNVQISCGYNGSVEINTGTNDFLSGVLTVPFGRVNARRGFTSESNPWNTSDSSFHPNGITTGGGTNWIYGLTYLGNAPSNGSGAEVRANGSSYFRSSNTGGTWGYAGQFVDRNNAANNYIPWSFESEYGNHSWGIVARFHIQQAGADRPSIQFSAAGGNDRWSLGYCTGSDWNFRINQNHGYRTDNSTQDGWGTERFMIDTSGTLWANGVMNLGPNSGADNGLSIRYGGGGYGRIRFYSDGSNHQTIHAFGTGWTGGGVAYSNNSININGGSGVTFGAWNVPDGYIATGGSAWFRYDVTAYSDSRVKDNVQQIENAIEKVQSIRGVTFTRNDYDDKSKRHAGVIAQEVLDVLPEVVNKDESGMYSVAYGNMAALFIEAIKEQQQQIRAQAEQISELKSIIDALTK